MQWHLPHWFFILRKIRLIDKEKLLLMQRSVMSSSVILKLLGLANLVVLGMWNFTCDMFWECWMGLRGNRSRHILLIILLMTNCSLRESNISRRQVIKWSKRLVRVQYQIILGLLFRLLASRRFMSRWFLKWFAFLRLFFIIIFFLFTFLSFLSIYVFTFSLILVLICMYLAIVKLLSLLGLGINWCGFGRTFFGSRAMFFRGFTTFHYVRIILLVCIHSHLALLMSSFTLWDMGVLLISLLRKTLHLLFFIRDMVRLENTQTLESNVEFAKDSYFLIVEVNLMDLYDFQKGYSSTAG